MNKKTIIPVICLLLILLLCVPAFASESSASRVYDYAGMLTGTELNSLEALLASVSAKNDFDVVVVTEKDTGDYTGQKYADSFYEVCVSYYGMREDGILLLWIESTSEAYISTSGYGTYAFTDAGLSYLFDEIGPSLRSRDYAAAFRIFAEKSGELVAMAKAGNRMTTKPGAETKKERNPIVGAIGSLIAGLLPPGILTGSWKNRLKSVHQNTSARGYAVEGSFVIEKGRDTFLYNDVTKTKKENGTTVHKSDSGQVHGGASRKF